MTYAEDDMLMLSGIQHYAFCPRQWALIHIEQQWNENLLTTEGRIMHQHVDDPFYRQKMGSRICLRAVSIASKKLGLYGVSDAIELYPSDDEQDTITHPAYPGFWTPYPVEYKHGKPKHSDIDIVQLAAQAMCLEEQYDIRVNSGAIFYGETKRRVEVDITDELRSAVRSYAEAMHEIFRSGIVPCAEQRPYCKSCSLKDICMPETANRQSASNYLKRNLYAETS